jgi:hypothetical protein
MRRKQFDHVLRAAGDLLGETEIWVAGSQAILGSGAEDLPVAAMMSPEVDVMPADGDAEKALRIHGGLGELSRFHETVGVYADGIENLGEGLIRLPEGWRDRVIDYSSPETEGVVAKCVEIHDVCISKLLANRDKDNEYVRALINSGHVKPELILERLDSTAMLEFERQSIVDRLLAFRRRGRSSAFKKALWKARDITPKD